MQTNEKKRDFKEVWTVVDGKDGKDHWTRLGAAFTNRDGSHAGPCDPDAVSWCVLGRVMHDLGLTDPDQLPPALGLTESILTKITAANDAGNFPALEALLDAQTPALG